MYKLAEISFFLTVFAPIPRIEVAADVQVFCTRYAKNGSIIRFCCPGFEGDGVNCTFLCHNGCANGRCVGPLTCECNEGFAKKNGPNSPCEPISRPLLSFHEANCPHRCSNGTCVEGVCMCDHGWKLQSVEAIDLCVPQCEKYFLNGGIGCLNGYCSRPGICTCYDGFAPVDHNEFECVHRVSGELWTQLWAQHCYLISLAGMMLTLLLMLMLRKLLRNETKVNQI